MREFAGDTLDAGIVSAETPAGDAGLDMHRFHGSSRPRRWMLTITASAPTDVIAWGAIEGADDRLAWAQHPGGPVGDGLPAGAHHVFVENLGVYERAAFTKSNPDADVSVLVTEIHEARETRERKDCEPCVRL